jgi:hypothetical protein
VDALKSVRTPLVVIGVELSTCCMLCKVSRGTGIVPGH